MNDSTVIDYIVDCKIKGALVECGVQDGRIEKIWIEKLKQRNEERDIYMYDTFTGLTEPSEKDVSINNEFRNADVVMNTWKVHNRDGVNTWCYCPLEQVVSDFLQIDYPFHRINFIKGDVRESLLIKDNIPDKIAVLRLDTDWYESTYHELVHLFPKLVTGGVIIIDDYGHWKGAREAVDKYFKEQGVQILLNRIDYTGRIGIKN